MSLINIGTNPATLDQITNSICKILEISYEKHMNEKIILATLKTLQETSSVNGLSFDQCTFTTNANEGKDGISKVS